MSVRYTIEDEVAIVTIDRSDRRNAVDSATAAELIAAFEKVEGDDDIHVAILTGAGEHFCAGADLKALSEGDRRPIGDSGPGPMGPTQMQLSKPVIAAVEGFAVAGGLELALWCDMRVAARSAKFGVFCRRFGVPLVDLGAVRLPRLIGQSRAADLILTGREVDAEEALAFGLANRIAEEGEALAAAKELAKQIAAFPQLCLRNDRRVMIEQWALDEEAAIALEARLGRETVASGETASGAARFAGGKGRHGKF